MYKSYQLNNKVELRNRLVVAPMTTWSSNDDLTVSDQELEYYALRSKEVGMMITGCTFVNKDYQGFDHEFFGGSDEYIPSLKSLTEAIKSEGAKAILQVFHAGRKGIANNGETVSASAVKPTYKSSKREILTPRAMTTEEVYQFINNFKATVKRAIVAGFDGVEIHGANTYLIQQFFSAHTNLRTDEWGGSLEKRIKLPLAIVKASIEAKKEEKAPNFIIGYRFSPEELEDNGITIEDTLYLVDQLSNTELDYLHISLGRFDQSSIREKDNTDIIGKLILDKIGGRKPFIGVGGIKNRENIDAAESIGYDLLAVGSAMITDPEFVSKTKNHQEIKHTVSKSKYKDIKIPDRLMNVITTSVDWFELEE